MVERDSSRNPSETLTVGTWGATRAGLREELIRRSYIFDIRQFDSMPTRLDVLSIDCFVAIPGGGETPFEAFYDHVRRTHPTKPIVIISDGTDQKLLDRIEADEHAANVPLTETGIPYAMLVARIKRLSGYALSGAPVGDRSTAYRVRTLEFYLLWGVAALTYGVGDFLSTIAAVYLVPGLVEGNPVIATVLEVAGIPGFVAVKIAVFVIAIGVSVRGANANDWITYYAPPIFVTVLGLGLTTWNVSLILLV